MIRSIFLSFKHLIYAVLILATLGGLAEVGLRVYDSATGQVTRRSQYDRGIVCKSWFMYQTLKPAHQFAVKNPDSGERVTVSINSLGLRGAEIPTAKRSGVFRIVCLGDERTLAPQVTEEQTFCHLLQQKLKAKTGAAIEVINAGVPDYCPLLSCLQFKHQLLALQPNLVIQNFDMSDVADDYHLRKRAVLDSNGGLLCCPHPDLEVPKGMSSCRPCDMFLLPRWGREQIGRIWTEKMLAEPHRNISTQDGKYLWLEDHSPDWEVYIRQALLPLESLQDQVEAQHAHFLVCVPPAPWQVSATASAGAREKAGVAAGSVYASAQPFNAIREYCAKRKIPCCELLAAFKSQPRSESLYLNNAAALSAAGHALYAQELAQFVLQNAPGPWNGSPASPNDGEIFPRAASRAP